MIVGLICSLTPHIVAILFGRYVLRMNPLILLGACAGAGTITAALRAIQDEAQSKVPAIGYTVPYAIGNILLTAWGPVLVALMSPADRPGFRGAHSADAWNRSGTSLPRSGATAVR